MKVSVSRPTGPPSQASANSNISVYVSLNRTLYMHDLFILHMQLDFYFQYCSISLMVYQILLVRNCMFQVSNASLQCQTIGIIKNVNSDFNLVIMWFSSELGEDVILCPYPCK